MSAYRLQVGAIPSRRRADLQGNTKGASHGYSDDASYLLHVTAALDAGASVDEVTAVLTAVGPNVGVFRMVAAADPLATALGINLADQQSDRDQRSNGERRDRS